MDKNANRSKSSAKKNLIRTKRQSNSMKIIITLGVLAAIAVSYFLIDKGSHVGTVNNNRITKAEYLFFLSQQKMSTESQEGISSKTAEEKEAFWLKTTDGQNPWETAKLEALNNSKEYMIQILEASKLGLKVDSSIKSQAESSMADTKTSLGSPTDRQFDQYIKSIFGINTTQLTSITEKLILIDKFKTQYIDSNYKAPELSDDDVKARYDEDTKVFDKVDIRYVALYKTDDNGTALAQAELDKKKAQAEEALAKLKAGDNIDEVIKAYTEEEAAEGSTEPLGKATLAYSESSSVQDMVNWAFAGAEGDTSFFDTTYVYYTVIITGRTDYDDVKATVKSTIESENETAFYEGALKKWSAQSEYNIVKNDWVYDSIGYK